MSSKAARSRSGHDTDYAVFGGTMLVAAALVLAPVRDYAALPAEPLAQSDTAHSATDLQRRIAAQDAIIAATERMKQQLHEPRAIWATERAALPHNYREIEAYRERIAILERDLDTARRMRDALAAALQGAPAASGNTTQQEEP